MCEPSTSSLSHKQITSLSLSTSAEETQVTIYEVAALTFLIYDDRVAQTLERKYRMMSSPLFEKKTLPQSLMNEQVQVLLENGYVNIRRVSNIDEIDAPPLLQEENDVKLINLARKIAVGRKVKEIKRKKLSPEASASMLKVRKIDEQAHSELFNSVTDTELTTALEELRKKRTQKLAEFDSAEQLNNSNLNTSKSHKIVEWPKFPASLTYQKRLVVFRDLWRKGFYLTAGTKFGCDFLAYQKPPSEVHSTYMVLCIDTAEDSLSPLNLIAASRVGSQVKKQLLLAIVSPDSMIPYYIKSNWWKGNE